MTQPNDSRVVGRVSCVDGVNSDVYEVASVRHRLTLNLTHQLQNRPGAESASYPCRCSITSSEAAWGFLEGSRFGCWQFPFL